MLPLSGGFRMRLMLIAAVAIVALAACSE